jgi:hypothetical protein
MRSDGLEVRDVNNSPRLERDAEALILLAIAQPFD